MKRRDESDLHKAVKPQSEMKDGLEMRRCARGSIFTFKAFSLPLSTQASPVKTLNADG